MQIRVGAVLQHYPTITKETISMFNRRFIPYLIGICIFVFLSLSYIGFRAYQNHVEFKALMSDAKMFQWSLDKDAPPQRYEYTGNFRMDELTLQEVTGPDGETYKTIVPPGMDIETLQTGGYFIEFSHNQMVTQLVETPDGEIHELVVPRGFEVQEGAAVSRVALDPPLVSFTTWINGKKYEIPEGEDVHVYGKKLLWVHELEIPMEEVERKIATGEIDISFSEQEKRDIERDKKIREEILKGQPTETPPMSDKLPVKVRFMTDEEIGQAAPSPLIPAWAPYFADPHQQPHNKVLEPPLHSGEHSGGIDGETGRARGHTNFPVSPLDLPGMIEPIPAHRSEPGFEAANKTPAPSTIENLETQFRGGLSPERFNRAQQLIDEYGSEEGLRRLREMDPEAARQFEQPPPQSPRKQGENRVPSRDVPDGEQSESGSKD